MSTPSHRPITFSVQLSVGPLARAYLQKSVKPFFYGTFSERKQKRAALRMRLLALMKSRGEITLKDAVSAIPLKCPPSTIRDQLYSLGQQGWVDIEKKMTFQNSSVFFFKLKNPQNPLPTLEDIIQSMSQDRAHTEENIEARLLNLIKSRRVITVAEANQCITPMRSIACTNQHLRSLYKKGLIRYEKHIVPGYRTVRFYFPATPTPAGEPVSLQEKYLSSDAFDLLTQVASINDTALHAIQPRHATLKESDKKRFNSDTPPISTRKPPSKIRASIMALLRRREEITIKDAVSSITTKRTVEAFHQYFSFLYGKGLITVEKRDLLTGTTSFYRRKKEGTDTPKPFYTSIEDQLLAIIRERGMVSMAEATTLLTPARNSLTLQVKFRNLINKGLVRCEKHNLNGRSTRNLNVYFDATIPPLHNAHIVAWQNVATPCTKEHPLKNKPVVEIRRKLAESKIELLSLIQSRGMITTSEAASLITDRAKETLLTNLNFLCKTGWVYFEKKLINKRRHNVYMLTDPERPLPQVEDIVGITELQYRDERLLTQILAVVMANGKIVAKQIGQLLTPPKAAASVTHACLKLMAQGRLRREQLSFSPPTRGNFPYLYVDVALPLLYDAHVSAWKLIVFRSKNNKRLCKKAKPKAGLAV
jgi:predicted transcriptional regulator